MSVGLGVEAKRPGERVDDLRARVDGAALFEPRVPRHAHARELGDLFSAQARGVAPAADDGETEIFWVQLSAAGTEEGGELGPPGGCGVGHCGPHGRSVPLSW